MAKSIPSIQKYMTTAPHSIEADQSLTQAHLLLEEHRIRHLPVLRGGRLVGIVTQRDLALIQTLQGVDVREVKVEDAMSSDVYSVSPDAALDEVVSEMAEKKLGSAVVVSNQKVVGIFTTVDVCAALADLLHSRLK